MATLINQGTLLFTPECGRQGSISSNVTVTEVEVNYGFEVLHAASPETFAPGDVISYTVLLRNTGSGTLYNPEVTVELPDGDLSYVAGSATAFLYANGEVTTVPLTVTQNSPVTFTLDTEIPAGGFVFIVYQATVESTDAESITSVATGRVNAGSPEGEELTDSDSATITRRLLSIVKNAPESAAVGDTISYVFEIENDSAVRISFDTLTDQLPEDFSFTGAALTVNGMSEPLVEGVDYTLSAEGLFVLTPQSTVFIPAGGSATLTITGVVTA